MQNVRTRIYARLYMLLNVHTPCMHAHTDICMHIHMHMHALIHVHPDMKIIKIKASDLYEKSKTDIYKKFYFKEQSVQGRLSVIILLKRYLNQHTFIHSQAL